jgi:hypothetical protein
MKIQGTRHKTGKCLLKGIRRDKTRIDTASFFKCGSEK